MGIKFEVNGGIATFTIDNPPVNVFTPRMHKEFYDALLEFNRDKSIRVGILTGAGTRAFSGGDDIKVDWGYPSLEETLDAHFWDSTEADVDRRPGWDRELMAVTRFKPIIGAINGPAMGQGLMYLFCHTDIRISVPSAKLGFPEITYGMGGASGWTQIARHFSPAKAMWMLLTGESITAEEAHNSEFINEIVDPAKLLPRAMEIAMKIASHPALAVRVEMEAFQRSMEMPRSDAIAFTTHLYRLQRAAHLLKPGATANPLGSRRASEEG